MNDIVNSLLASPRTYIPLLAIGVTWISDTIFPMLGLPVLTPDAKESLTVLLFALAIFFLRAGAIKTKDLSTIMTAMSEYLTKEIKQGSATERKKAFEEQLSALTNDEEKTRLILDLLQKSHQPTAYQIETDFKKLTEDLLKK